MLLPYKEVGNYSTYLAKWLLVVGLYIGASLNNLFLNRCYCSFLSRISITRSYFQMFIAVSAFCAVYALGCCGTTLIKRHGQMSIQTKIVDTWGVLQNLLICFLSFYSVYYIIVSVCIGVFRVNDVDTLLAPFDYTTQPSWQNPKYLVSVISTELTYIVAGLMFAWIVEEWVWDYAITITLIHIGLTMWVMSDFPSTEHWWITLGCGLLMMIFGGQLLAYKLFRNNFVYPAELQDF